MCVSISKYTSGTQTPRAEPENEGTHGKKERGAAVQQTPQQQVSELRGLFGMEWLYVKMMVIAEIDEDEITR
jgi:hypothetical protein